jgi:hypothetical protein
VERDSGRAFDPKIVDILKRKYTELEQSARSGSLEPWRLSTDINIERGGEPGAGFATTERTTPVSAATESERARIAGLLEAVATGARFLSPTETFSIFSTRLSQLVPYDSLAIFVRDGKDLVPAHTAGTQAAALQAMKVPVGCGISGWVAEVNRPVVNGNADLELRPMRSALAVPLNGQVSSGVLTLYRAAEGTFTSDELALLASFGPALATYLEGSWWAKPVETAIALVQ